LDTNYLENNYLTLVGKVTGEKKFSHEIYGESFYVFNLEIPRLSGNSDIIPITISERLIKEDTLQAGKKLLVKGQFRSYNSYENERNKLTITNSKFTGNEALGTTTDTTDSSFLASGNGGAIANNFATTTVSNTVFEKNEAKNWGGAISNMMFEKIEDSSPKEFHTDKGGVISIADSTFTNNVAGQEGGAIYNMKNATVKFTGNNVFSGNKAGDTLNDIHNKGAITVSGSLTLDGGISGTGTTTFEDGSQLTVIANVTKIANNVKNEGATLNLTLDNGYTGTYQLVTGTLDNEFTIAQNNLYNIETTGTNGTYDISKKSSSEISASTGANANQAGAVNAITGGNSDSGSTAFDNIANNINTLMQSGNSADVQTALNAVTALAPEVAPMVQRSQRV